MNVFSFTGNLGRDAATNNVGGTAVANFAVAVKAGFGDNEQTVWVDCALWGKRAEGGLVQYLTKGQPVAVTGELGTREYQGNDGENRTVITCRVNDVTLMGSRSDSAPAPQQQTPQMQQRPAPAPQQAPAPQYQSSPPMDFDDSDIPF